MSSAFEPILTRWIGEEDSHTLDFYRNRTEQETRSIIDVDEVFSRYGFETIKVNCFGQPDLYFWGIKRGEIAVSA